MSEIDTHRNTARAARDQWAHQIGLWHAELMFNAVAAGVKELAERVFKVYEAAFAGNEGRSTPIYIADGAIVTDFRNTEWRYSEPNDTWALAAGSGGHSDRSWQKLNYVYGPLTLKDG